MKPPKQFRNLPKKRKNQKPYQQAWEFLSKTEVPLDGIPQQTAKLATTSALTGSLLFGPTALLQTAKTSLQPSHEELPIHSLAENLAKEAIISQNTRTALAAQLIKVLPPEIAPLDKKQEKEVSRILQESLQIKAAVELEGKRLNVSFGMIGAEQHLRRFPQDNVSLHNVFPESGLAVRNGAWGLFASSPEALSEDLKQKEKYYFAVQTFLSPNWSNNSLYVKDWFKYRKMLAINPKTGQAVVGVVADAGPATWTGKDFGGSPEVMAALGLEKIKQGEILLLFVDDPENEIPLGPITT